MLWLFRFLRATSCSVSFENPHNCARGLVVCDLDCQQMLAPRGNVAWLARFLRSCLCFGSHFPDADLNEAAAAADAALATSASLIVVFPKRYKKGRPLWWNRGEREVGSSGGFAPRPPRFNALVPVRKLGKGKTGSFADPASVPAPGTALGLLFSRALSSAQAKAIVAKEREENEGADVSNAPSGWLSKRKYGQPFNGSALNPEGSVQ